jgi:serine/threonine-protein kinase RsbW
MTTNTVQLVIPAEAEYIELVRLTIFGLGNRMGFNYEDIEDMKVAVAEACNNAVLHAYSSTEAEKETIELSFHILGETMTIEIKDRGSSFDVQREAGQSTSLHDKELEDIHAGGLGLFLMQALMDEVEVHNEGGTRVMMTKHLRKTEGIV